METKTKIISGSALLIIMATLLLTTGSSRCSSLWQETDVDGIYYCEDRDIFRACSSLSSTHKTCYHISDYIEEEKSGIVLSQKFDGYRILSSTGKEDWFYETSINGNEICFELKTILDYEKEVCKIDEKTKELNCFNILYTLPSEIITSKEKVTSLSKMGDRYCRILKPFEDMYYKFGNETIIIEGDTSYEVNASSNITQETGFAHLSTKYNFSLYMPFDVDTTTVRDYSDYNNDGVINNVIWSSNGKIGGAYDFDGDGDYIQIPDSDSLDAVRTWSAWIYRAEDAGHDEVILSKYYYITPTRQYDLRIDADSTWCAGSTDCLVLLTSSTGTTNVITVGTSDIPIDTWVHVAATYDGTCQQLYVNGVAEGTCDYQCAISALTSPLFIGKYSGGATQNFNGTMDEITLWNYSLSALDILDLYNSQLERFYPQGTMLFENLNLGTNDTVNVSIINCQELNGTDIYASVNAGSKTAFDANCEANEISITGSASNMNLTIWYNPTEYNFYSPVIIGNITLDGYIATVDNYPQISLSINDTTPEAGVESVYIECNATDDIAISTYKFNVTYPNGSILYEDLIENTSVTLYNNSNLFVLGTYDVSCWVNDSANQVANATNSFIVADTLAPVFGSYSNQTVEYNLGYDLNATDVWLFDEWFINDTANFKINQSGYIENNTALSFKTYDVNVSTNDSSNNVASIIFKVIVQDTTEPNITSITLVNGIDWIACSCTATDNYGIDKYVIAINGTGESATLSTCSYIFTNLVNGTDYNISITVNDTSNNQDSDSATDRTMEASTDYWTPWGDIDLGGYLRIINIWKLMMISPNGSKYTIRVNDTGDLYTE